MPRDVEIRGGPPIKAKAPAGQGTRVSESKSRNWVIGYAAENSKSASRSQRRPKSLRLDVIKPRGSFGTSKDWSAYSDPDPDLDNHRHHLPAKAITGPNAELIRAEIEAEKARVLRSQHYAKAVGGRP